MGWRGGSLAWSVHEAWRVCLQTQHTSATRSAPRMSQDRAWVSLCPKLALTWCSATYIMGSCLCGVLCHASYGVLVAQCICALHDGATFDSWLSPAGVHGWSHYWCQGSALCFELIALSGWLLMPLSRALRAINDAAVALLQCHACCCFGWHAVEPLGLATVPGWDGVMHSSVSCGRSLLPPVRSVGNS